MNICKKQEKEGVAYMKAGNLYTCGHDRVIRMCVSSSGNKLIMVSMGDGSLMSSLGNSPVIQPALYTDVTDQYCLSEVKK